MVNMRKTLRIVFGLLAVIAVIGTPLLLLSPDHAAHCPFASGQAILCSDDILAHVTHFELAFASILSAVFAVFCVAISWVHTGRAPPRDTRSIVARGRTSKRPNLFVELFSRGILNRREGYWFTTVFTLRT
jgi:hypothetical protein